MAAIDYTTLVIDSRRRKTDHLESVPGLSATAYKSSLILSEGDKEVYFGTYDPLDVLKVLPSFKDGHDIVLEDDPAARDEGAKALEHAVKIAAAAGVKMLTQSRWSVNVVSGISHAVKEYDASDLLVGLHRRTRLTDTFFGKLTADLLAAVERQVLVYRSDIPVNTVRRLHLLVPRKAEFEPGFAHWADSVALLAGQLSCRVDVYSGRDTLAALRAYWEARKYSTEATWNELRDWRNLLPVAHRTRHDHMLVFVTARRGTLSDHSWIDRLPEQVERHFSTRNVLIVFPTQYGAEGAAGSSVRSGLPVNIRTPHA